ncbi:MAG: Lrp/AsnC family transcriptional regulator [Caulobacteraceae bacterium]|nr:Lrp/AsnC family transcriptional regulator [Caulobacteraceae bacterium]
MSLTTDLDAFDIKILSALAEDGRMSWRDLSDRIGLSLTPTLRRVRRLEADGYVLGYSARLNEERLGSPISVFVSVTLSAQTEEAIRLFEQEIVKAPEVMSCFLMTGGADYMLRVVAPDLAGFHAFLMNSLTRVPGVAHIQSSFALRSVIQRTAPPLR